MENRLISVTENGIESGGSTTFAYDTNSQRTATLGNGGVIAASGRANNNKNGYLLFDYKYIGFDAKNDKWIFGQRVSNTNSDLYIINKWGCRG